MKTPNQFKCFHAWCGEVAAVCDRLWLMGDPKTVIKELVKEVYGNGCKAKGGMSTNDYPATPADMTEEEWREGVVSMSEMLAEMEAWAATDLNLELRVRDEYMDRTAG